MNEKPLAGTHEDGNSHAVISLITERSTMAALTDKARRNPEEQRITVRIHPGRVEATGHDE
jgi:hypothetical protein